MGHLIIFSFLFHVSLVTYRDLFIIWYQCLFRGFYSLFWDLCVFQHNDLLWGLIESGFSYDLFLIEIGNLLRSVLRAWFLIFLFQRAEFLEHIGLPRFWHSCGHLRQALGWPVISLSVWIFVNLVKTTWSCTFLVGLQACGVRVC